MSARFFVVAAILIAAARAGADANDEAKAHYTIGAAAYERSDYATAVREFVAAYELSKKADILFNIARAETKLGHDAEAIARLKEYLQMNPDASDLPSVKAEIEAREQSLAARQSAEAARLAAEKSKHEAEEQARIAEQAKKGEAAARASRPRWPALVLMGIGVAGLVGGIALGAVAAHDGSLVQTGAGSPTQFSGSTFESDQSAGKSAGKAGIALDVIGGAILVTGGVLLIWALRAPKEAPRAWISPTVNGFAAGGTF